MDGVDHSNPHSRIKLQNNLLYSLGANRKKLIQKLSIFTEKRSKGIISGECDMEELPGYPS